MKIEITTHSADRYVTEGPIEFTNSPTCQIYFPSYIEGEERHLHCGEIANMTLIQEDQS